MPVRVGLNVGTVDTEIVFDPPAKLREQAFSASVEIKRSPTFGVMISPGGVLGGTIEVEGVKHSISPGPLLGVAASWRVVDPATSPLFVLFGASLSASTVMTSVDLQRARLTAADLRFSFVAGKTFFDVLSPYAVVRAFGGPVYWKIRGETVSAGDRYHYHAGLGLSLAIPAGIDAFAEIAPLGEKRATLGVGATF